MPRSLSPLNLARLILCGSLALAGCGGQEPPEEIEEVADPASAPVLADEASMASVGVPEWGSLAEPWFGDWDEMVERRVVRAAVVHSKTLFFLDGGQPRGLTYEVLTRFEEFLNERLGTGHLKFHVVIIPLPREQLFPALLEGRVDISAANLTITQDRMEEVDFAAPLLSDVSELLVTRAGGPVLESVEDLSGMEIHVRKSSSYFQSLQRLNDRFRQEARPPILIVEADELLETEDLLELLDAGVIPATIADKHLADFWAQLFENIRVHQDIKLREGGSIAWAIRKGSPQLTTLLEEFARGHRAGTFLGNMALRQYLRSADYIVNPGGRGEAQKLEAAYPHFQRFAPEYGFNPLLLVAQGYQESRLDQSVVSPVGAVGVMQLMPTTAADPNVGIDDITVLENNVHAGTKYLRFLLDQYFQDGSLDPLNEHLFAFAAYNAGPNRIARLRAEAAETGLDPNLWFRNVEHVAARRIGRETVQYVSNVYKYYLAYRQIEELERLRKGPSD
jgi:membrane-bound lytic murein transglycosylase MltF